MIRGIDLLFVKAMGNRSKDVFFKDDMEDSFTTPSSKQRKLLALFQILFFIVNKGRKRTPFHLMKSEAIYNTCKSKTLISSLNHFGLGVSYDEVLRYHTDMVAYISEISENKIPLPSQFDPTLFTIGAFDNFDHEESSLSGIGGSHDTVMILMQDKPDADMENSGKPNISETGVVHGPRQFTEELACQKITDYIKPAKRPPPIPADYTVPRGLYNMDQTEREVIRAKDVAWTVSRLDLSDLENGVQEVCEFQEMPSWSSFNSLLTEEDIAKKTLGFCL